MCDVCMTFGNHHDCSKENKRDPIEKAHNRKRVEPLKEMNYKNTDIKERPFQLNVLPKQLNKF